MSDPISGHKAHDKWMVAVINAAVGMPPLNFPGYRNTGKQMSSSAAACNDHVHESQIRTNSTRLLRNI